MAVFSLLLLASSAVPVLAEPAPDEAARVGDVSESSPPASESAPVQLPDAEDVREGIEAAEAEEEARERWLASPEAVKQRQESRYAFAGLSGADSEALFLKLFSEQLHRLNADPARWLSDADIVEPLGESTATVQKEGDTTLLDATMPLRTEDEHGEPRKVDLTLEATPTGLEPANPLVALHIPDEADEGIAIGEGEESLSVTPLGMEAGRAVQPFGDKNAFYPDALGAEADTDQILAPTSTGVEIFELLRSADSPEVFRYRIEMPEGAELQPDETGGARIVREGKQLASIPFPYAVDAQGTPHEVDLEIEGGDTIVLRIAHREADVAYPLLLDPAIVNDYYNYNWFNGHNLDFLINGTWNYEENWGWIEGFTSCQYSCFGPSGRALYISMMPGAHNANEYGQWVFRSRNSSSFLSEAWANPFVRDDHGCSRSQYPEPHDFLGMWHNNAWNSGVRLNQAAIYGYTTANGWGTALIIGMGTGGGSAAPCRRDLAVGGAAVWEDDWERPSLDTSSSDKWMDKTPIRLNVSATDSGLGVKSFEARATNSSGKTETWWTDHSCSGVAGSRCPNSWNLGESTQPILNYNPTALPEGLQSMFVTAYDVTEKPSWTEREMTLRIDHAAPTISLSGTLTEQAKLGTERPSYTIKAEAKDGVYGSTKPSEIRSGAVNIVIKNDGQVVGEINPGCPTQSCGGSLELEVPAAQLAPGAHTLTVTSADAMGHVGTKELKYSTGDVSAPSLSISGMPEESTAMPRRASYWNSFGSLGSGNGQLSHPADIAVDAEGNLWVVDENNNRVEKLNQAGGFLLKFGSSGSGNGQFSRPTSLAIDAKGNIWVTDAGNGRVQQFNAKGEYLAKFGAKGTGNGQFTGSGPEGIAIDGKGNIWVSDTYGGRVQEFNEKGEFLKIVSSKGSGTGQLGEPTGIDIGPNGDVWVADWQNNRVSVFNEAGGFVRQFGSSGTGNGQFSRADAIAVGKKGDVWVGDQNNGRVQEFNQSGQYVTQFGSPGSGKGQFSFSYPLGLATDSRGSIWITDTNNNRVQRWLIPNSTINGYLEPIDASATDSGYGVTSVAVKLTNAAQEAKVLSEATQACSQGACPLSTNVDDVGLSEMPSGPYILSASAKDGAGNLREVSRVFTLDSLPPEVELSGPLAESNGQPLGSPTANLGVKARDIDPASGGIKTINIERDDRLAATFPSNCATDCHEVGAPYSYHRVEDGAERKIQPVASGEASAGELKRISCISASDCWAVGRTKYTAGELAEGKTAAPLLEHWNGSQWQAVTVPKPSGAVDIYLEDVMCNASNACRAVGYYNDGSSDRPLAEVWNGMSWGIFAPALPSGVSGERWYGVSCPTSNNGSCWIYGRTTVTLAEQSEGKSPVSFVQKALGSWQAIPRPEGSGDAFIEGMTCSSTTLCRAVGYYSVGTVNLPLSETWDGTKWSATSLPLPAGATRAALSGLTCDPSGGCWAIGKTQVNSTEQAEGKAPAAFFERWTGSQWQTSMAPSTPDSLSTSLNDVSCASASACTAVGNYEDSHAETRSFSYTYDGTEWRYQPTPAPPEASLSSLEGLACTGSNACSTVGYSQIESGKRTVLAEAEAPGSGPHSITIEAVDLQGNSASETIEVDLPVSTDETPQCDQEASSVSPKATVTPSQARTQLETVLPEAVEPSEGAIEETSEVEVDPTYSEPQPDLAAVHSLADGETAVDPEGGFALADVACVVPDETTSAATEATVVNQDTALFANTAPETDTVIRPTAGGTTLVQSIRGPSSPNSFSWTVEVSSGQELEELPSGAIAIVEDPPAGEEGETPDLPMPDDAESPKALTAADLQMELADYQLATAQSETSQEVVAVIAKPWVVLSEEWIIPAKIEVRPDVSIPIKWELEVTLPQAALEAAVYPVGLSIEFLSSLSVNGHCPRGQSPCGSPDLDRAARYAVYWGNENHNGARNPYYENYGSNNCTNFVSQILFAGGTKFMKAFDKGDGSWWEHTLYPGTAIVRYHDTESWRLADKLPQHLWEYGLVHIDIQQPWAWTKGTILAEDWYGTNGKGDFNHMQFVVGTIDSPQGPREPLIANESSAGHNYSNLPWSRVKERIQADQGGNGWNRVALPLKHTNANLKEKRYESADLYDSSGLFGS